MILINIIINIIINVIIMIVTILIIKMFAGQLIYVNCYGVTSAAYVLLTTLVTTPIII